MTAPAKTVSDEDKRDIYNRDIALANQYRQDGIRHCMTLATATFAFTLTFHKEFAVGALAAGNLYKASALIGWLSLLLSITGGLVHMKAWERFYASYIADAEGRDEAGRRTRAGLRTQRIWSGRVQYVGLIAGLAFIALYVLPGFLNAPVLSPSPPPVCAVQPASPGK